MCPALQLRIHWVLAHVGINSNEAVDALAKEAAQGSSSPLHSRICALDTPLPLSKATAIADGTRAFCQRWLVKWSKSPRFARLVEYDTSGSMHTSTGSTSLPPPTVSTAASRSPSPHFLLQCPTLRLHRLCLVQRLGTARLTLQLPLSAKSEAGPVLAFVRDTGRLPRYSL
ncbi:hypothetical protein B0H17DRAFT_1211197 [Mycena rosella]|uniref:RNase H type-1 domain-containing protein n=1 Tax=Mycena rosella TaxID=1033263 RepID=A0AAD7G4A2_MYCRO|nr:hypothetical protein B0H17DRAFT_1211197 [Mycena rosella]